MIFSSSLIPSRPCGIATDLDGELLVWAPEGRTAQAKRTALSEPLPALRQAERPPAPTADRDLPSAERRHLTVMFCDLADSTHLSAGLDPEDMGDVIRAYHEAVSEAVRRFDGYIAKFMGDGVLIYFGYPNAQEKDAERAVRTGLAILDAAAPGSRRGKRATARSFSSTASLGSVNRRSSTPCAARCAPKG
jgi:class 3 adenylate cyclase